MSSDDTRDDCLAKERRGNFKQAFAIVPKVSALETVQPLKSPKTSWNLTPQPTANDKLQGLAFAATGFALQMAWLSRVALLMPLLLAAAQQIQPDSPESLAQRLWEAGVTCNM